VNITHEKKQESSVHSKESFMKEQTEKRKEDLTISPANNFEKKQSKIVDRIIREEI
jgi:hypothetical protein